MTPIFSTFCSFFAANDMALLFAIPANFHVSLFRRKKHFRCKHLCLIFLLSNSWPNAHWYSVITRLPKKPLHFRTSIRSKDIPCPGISWPNPRSLARNWPGTTRLSPYSPRKELSKKLSAGPGKPPGIIFYCCLSHSVESLVIVRRSHLQSVSMLASLVLISPKLSARNRSLRSRISMRSRLLLAYIWYFSNSTLLASSPQILLLNCVHPSANSLMLLVCSLFANCWLTTQVTAAAIALATAVNIGQC